MKPYCLALEGHAFSQLVDILEIAKNQISGTAFWVYVQNKFLDLMIMDEKKLYVCWQFSVNFFPFSMAPLVSKMGVFSPFPPIKPLRNSKQWIMSIVKTFIGPKAKA